MTATYAPDPDRAGPRRPAVRYPTAEQHGVAHLILGHVVHGAVRLDPDQRHILVNGVRWPDVAYEIAEWLVFAGFLAVADSEATITSLGDRTRLEWDAQACRRAAVAGSVS